MELINKIKSDYFIFNKNIKVLLTYYINNIKNNIIYFIGKHNKYFDKIYLDCITDRYKRANYLKNVHNIYID